MEDNQEKTGNNEEINENKPPINPESEQKKPEIKEEIKDPPTEKIESPEKKEGVNVLTFHKNKKRKVKDTIDVSATEVDKISIGGGGMIEKPQKGKIEKIEPSEPIKKEHKGSPEKTANMMTKCFSVGLPRLCSMYSKRPVNEYDLTKREERELKEVTVEYFETIQLSANPFWLFLFAFLMITGGRFWEAHTHKNEDKEKEARKRKKEAREQRAAANKKTIERKLQVEPKNESVQQLEQPKKSQLPELSLEDILEGIEQAGYKQDFPEKTNDRGSFYMVTKGKYKGFYMYDSSKQKKRYAFATTNEHTKDKNNQPSLFVLNAYESIKASEEVEDEKTAFKLLGNVIRRIKKNSK